MLPLHDLPLLNSRRGYTLLDGVRVLDLTSSIAGPYAAMMLADMGADVLKIERPGKGDDARHWGPPYLGGESLWFLSVNRNKRSLALDHTSDEGREVLHGLVREADVVILNSLPRIQAKLGLSYEALSAVNPGLIYVSITGFGLTGARADWACYDLIAEGYSGIMDLTGERDGEPQKVGAPAADMLAAMDAAFATVSALYERACSGRGHKIDISLVESMSRFLSPRIVSYLGSGELPRRSGGKDSVIAIYQAFETADDPITLALGNDGIWRRFWQAVGQPEQGEDAATASNDGRREHRPTVVKRIQEILRTRPRSYWLSLFSECGVPAGPINRLDEVVRDEHLLERGLFFAVEEQGRERIPQLGGLRVDGQAPALQYLPPRLGQHSQEVLRQQLGYTAEAVAELQARGIIQSYQE